MFPRSRSPLALALLLVLALIAPVSAQGAVLLGAQTVLPTVDSNAAGRAEAFRTPAATASGTLSSLAVYVDAGSTATKLTAGLYADAAGHPGELLAQGTLSAPPAGAWATVPTTGASVVSGTTYWIAVMGPVATGTLKFRERQNGAGRAEVSSSSSLSVLPQSWSGGASYTDGPLAAYGSSGTVSTPTLVVSPTSLSLTATTGGAAPSPALLSITNGGAGSLSYTVADDAPWLAVSPASGSAPGSVTVTATTTGLAAGTYDATATVTAAGAAGSPATVPVRLVVSDPPPPPPPAGPADWLQINHDEQRTGFAGGETALGTAQAGRLTQSWSAALDGKVTAQSLYVGGVTVAGATHDVVLASTNKNSVYALDALTGETLWRRNLGAVSANCAIPGGFGVTGPPAIDKARGRIYVVSDDGVLHTLALATGADTVPGLTLVDRPATNKVWGGLTLTGSTLYVTTASDGCDTPPWRGQVYRVDTAGSAPQLVNNWVVVPGIAAPNGGGGIWGYGGLSADPADGRVYAATGADSNEAFTPYGDRMVALSPSLSVLGSWEPTHPSQFPCNGDPCDLDFGATPVVFHPSGCPTMVAAGNKDGKLYVFDAAALAVNGQPRQQLQLNATNDWLGSGGIGGTPAWWPDGRMLFVGDAGTGFGAIAAGVVGLTVGSDCNLAVSWSRAMGTDPNPISTPTVANGVVYAGEGQGGRVFAFNAVTGVPLWNSGSAAGGFMFASPTVAAGALFAGTWVGQGAGDAGVIRAFRPSSAPTATVLLGDQQIESQLDSSPGGTAEAFQATATAGGTLAKLSIFVDGGSGAGKLVAGVYADAAGHPGALISQGGSTTLTTGRFNDVAVPGGSIVAGQKYWIAVLGTGGTLRFRDRNGGCKSEASVQTTMTALPATWQTGPIYADCPLSGYGAG
jgi:outer membrane protein assembly factor BamB